MDDVAVEFAPVGTKTWELLKLESKVALRLFPEGLYTRDGCIGTDDVRGWVDFFVLKRRLDFAPMHWVLQNCADPEVELVVSPERYGIRTESSDSVNKVSMWRLDARNLLFRDMQNDF